MLHMIVQGKRKVVLGELREAVTTFCRNAETDEQIGRVGFMMRICNDKVLLRLTPCTFWLSDFLQCTTPQMQPHTQLRVVNAVCCDMWIQGHQAECFET